MVYPIPFELGGEGCSLFVGEVDRCGGSGEGLFLVVLGFVFEDVGQDQVCLALPG